MRSLLALLYTPRCALCGCPPDDGSILCAPCTARLPALDPPRCSRCQAPLADPMLDLCLACGTTCGGFAEAVALGPYEGPWGYLVRLLKFDGERAIGRLLARRMSSLVASNGWARRIEAVTFVPRTRREARDRGLNPSRVLARYLGRSLRIPAIRLLRKRHTTRRQTGLSGDARRANLRDAFDPSRPGGTTALLVDDIYTTGATAEACADALRRAGWEEILVLTVARAHGGPR